MDLQETEEERLEPDELILLSTLLNVIFGSQDETFKARIFAELGSTDRMEIARILADKLYSTQ